MNYSVEDVSRTHQPAVVIGDRRLFDFGDVVCGNDEQVDESANQKVFAEMNYNCFKVN